MAAATAQNALTIVPGAPPAEVGLEGIKTHRPAVPRSAAQLHAAHDGAVCTSCLLACRRSCKPALATFAAVSVCVHECRRTIDPAGPFIQLLQSRFVHRGVESAWEVQPTPAGTLQVNLMAGQCSYTARHDVVLPCTLDVCGVFK